MGNNKYPQGEYVCPICNKEFEANDDTRYVIHGGYTCSWGCFLNEVKRLEKEKNEDDTPRRGRKRKNS